MVVRSNGVSASAMLEHDVVRARVLEETRQLFAGDQKSLLLVEDQKGRADLIEIDHASVPANGCRKHDFLLVDAQLLERKSRLGQALAVGNDGAKSVDVQIDERAIRLPLDGKVRSHFPFD